MTPGPIADLVMNRKILVICGAGGVGKTTTATGLALAAAREGRRVLALTVDPSKRLAQTLGVDRNLPSPISIPEERLRQAGIEPPGSLETWMLDPKLVADRVVQKLASDPEEIERLMNNRIYKGISRMVAGMQEYMAMEALYDFHQEGKYDLVILDTPPSRNALAFLEGPQRMAHFLEGRVFQLFLPPEGGAGFFRRTAGMVVDRVNSMVFGEETYRDFQEFFQHFGGILGVLNSNAGKMIERLQNPAEVAFVLVTSPTDASVADAHFFRERTREMGLPFSGFVLNRSQALAEGRQMPDPNMMGPDASPAMKSGFERLMKLALVEKAEMERDGHLLATLAEEAGPDAFTLATPTLPGGANDMPSLIAISEALWGAQPR